MNREQLHELFDAYMDQTLTNEQKVELEQLLISSGEARESFWRNIQMHTQVHEFMREGRAIPGSRTASATARRRIIFKPLVLALAASVAIAAGVWWVSNQSSMTRLRGATARQVSEQSRGRTGGAVVARVEEVSGFSVSAFAQGATADTQVSGKEKKQLQVGDEVRDGMRIETGEGGRVKLAYAGEDTTVALAENSKFEIRSSKLGHLGIGRLAAVVAKQDKGMPLVVETPQARMTVVGTKFSAKASQDMTRLDVEKGLVQLDRLADGATTNVPAGCFAIAADRLELAAYPAGTKYIKGRLLVQEDFEQGLDQWVSFQAKDLDAVQRYRDRALPSLQPDAQGLECRIVPRFDGQAHSARSPQAGKCLMLSAERGQGQFVGVRTKRSIGIVPFVMEWEVYACDAPRGKGPMLLINVGAAWSRLIDTLENNPVTFDYDVWMRLRTEWVSAEDSHGKDTWQMTRYLDGKLRDKSIVEDTKTDRFPFTGVADIKAYVDNIRVWELVSVEKVEE